VTKEKTISYCQTQIINVEFRNTIVLDIDALSDAKVCVEKNFFLTDVGKLSWLSVMENSVFRTTQKEKKEDV
jgi:hypothetical protein